MAGGAADAAIRDWLQSRGHPLTTAHVKHWRATGYQDFRNPPPRPVKRIPDKRARLAAQAKTLALIEAGRVLLFPARLYAKARDLYGFDTRGEYPRCRAAVLAAVCAEFFALEGRAPASRLHRALAKKYHGVRVAGKAKLFLVSASKIVRACRVWRDARVKSPDLFLDWGRRGPGQPRPSTVRRDG